MATASRSPLDIEAALASVPLFGSLSVDELGALAALTSTRSYPRGEVIFREGEEAISCFVVVAGEVDVTTEALGSSTTQVRDIVVGTLVIDLIDAKPGQVAWRGMGVKEIDTQAKPEKRDKSINGAVEKIFKNYPPKKK
jgi:hypothetical protein